MKAFLPRQKNDAADAKAFARALGDPEMRFVEVKSVEQQASLMLPHPEPVEGQIPRSSHGSTHRLDHRNLSP